MGAYFSWRAQALNKAWASVEILLQIKTNLETYDFEVKIGIFQSQFIEQKFGICITVPKPLKAGTIRPNTLLAPTLEYWPKDNSRKKAGNPTNTNITK